MGAFERVCLGPELVLGVDCKLVPLASMVGRPLCTDEIPGLEQRPRCSVIKGAGYFAIRLTWCELLRFDIARDPAWNSSFYQRPVPSVQHRLYGSDGSICVIATAGTWACPFRYASPDGPVRPSAPAGEW
jgi:hypothetical protein